MCCSLLLLEKLSPSAGTPLEKRSAGSHRAAISWITLAEGSARGAPWASSALTASEVGGICDTSVVARLSPTRSRSSTAARCTHGFSTPFEVQLSHVLSATADYVTAAQKRFC